QPAPSASPIPGGLTALPDEVSAIRPPVIWFRRSKIVKFGRSCQWLLMLGTLSAVRSPLAALRFPLSALSGEPDYGGSSPGGGPHGPHRASRPIVFQVPRRNPCLRIARRPNSEHEGVNRHCAPAARTAFDSVRW